MSPPPAEPTVARVGVNGLELLTRSIGAGPDVIVLHGGPGAHHDYLLPQFDALATGRRLRYYDQRGGGGSRVPRDVPVGWRQHVSDLDGLIGVWNADPATVVGYSWGGLLALLHAVERPDRIGRLALVSPAPPTAASRIDFEREFARRMQHPDVTREREALKSSGLRERDADAYWQRAFELSVAGYFSDPANARGLTPFRITARTQHEVWHSLRDYDIRDRVAALSVPAMVLHGRHDPIPLSSARETAELLGAELEVFEHSGHVPYVEEYDRFVSVLDAFLPRQ